MKNTKDEHILLKSEQDEISDRTLIKLKLKKLVFRSLEFLNQMLNVSTFFLVQSFRAA